MSVRGKAYDYPWMRSTESAAVSSIIATTSSDFGIYLYLGGLICNAEIRQLTPYSFSTRRQGPFSTTEANGLPLVLT